MVFSEILNLRAENEFVLKGPWLNGYTIVRKLRDI